MCGWVIRPASIRDQTLQRSCHHVNRLLVAGEEVSAQSLVEERLDDVTLDILPRGDGREFRLEVFDDDKMDVALAGLGWADGGPDLGEYSLALGSRRGREKADFDAFERRVGADRD